MVYNLMQLCVVFPLGSKFASMFSKIVSIIFAVGFVSVARGLVRERRSAYEAAVKCTEAGWDADVAALRAERGPAVNAKIIEASCK